MRIILILTLLLFACSPSVDPVLACQRRIVAAFDESHANLDNPVTKIRDWGRAPFVKFDRTGCSSQQAATVDQVVAMTYEIEALAKANQEAKLSGNEKQHIAAFQKFIKKFGGLNDFSNTVSAELARMEAEKAR